MHVALDSNVFIADRWLEKQGTRALVDYLKKTPWNFVLSEVVEVEVKAHTRRALEADAQKVAKTLSDARRQGLVGVPEFDADAAAAAASYAAWEARWNDTMLQLSAQRLPISAAAAREGARRAAERIPPCKPGGEGMRDALLWSSLVEAAMPGAAYQRLAFVSRNTKDFGTPDGTDLKEELAQDARDNHSGIAYYPSLDAFLKERAEPVAHIDRAWVLERLDMSEVTSIMEGWVYSKHYQEAMWAAGFDWGDLWEQNEVVEANSALIELTEFYVWQFDDDHLELRMRFRTAFDLDIRSGPQEEVRSLYPSATLYLREDLYPGGARHSRRERWEVQFDLPAHIEDDRIVELGMEDPVLYGVSHSP